MQHAHILARHDVNQLARLDVPDFDEAGLEGQDVGVAKGEGMWGAFPLDLPVGPCAPAVTVDEEAKVGVVEEKLAVETLDVDGTNVFLAGDEIE